MCPVCRKKCCCAVKDCRGEHRHCKAYRYRRRRAAMAAHKQSPVPGAPVPLPRASCDSAGPCAPRAPLLSVNG